MREKLVAPPEETIPQLAARCSTVSNRSARVSLNLEKLAANGRSESAGQMKRIASTVGDFVQEMDMLATLLEGTTAMSESGRRHLEVLITDADELASLTTQVIGQGNETYNLESAALEKLVQTEKTWKMMLQLVTSFQSLVQLQDEGDAAQVLEMTSTDFDELERLISRVQVTDTRQGQGQPYAIASSSRSPPPEDRTGLPDYDTVVSSPTIPADNKQQIPPSSPQDPGSPSFPAPKPKMGAVGGFFRSLSNKFGSPVPPLVTPLCQAAAAGNIDHVRGLLAQGADINGHNAEGYTSVTSAIHGEGHDNQLEMVRFLLDSGAKITIKDAIWSLPPLWHASRAGRADIVDLLISHGADPKGTTTSGFPYFFDAVEKDPAPVIELLIRRGADPNVKNLSGKAAIISCVKRGDMVKVRTLLDAGAKISATTPTGHPMLSIAVSNKNTEMAQFLLSYGAKPHGSDGYGNSLLSLAVESQDVAMARLLLSSGAFPNGTDIYGNPALITAMQKDAPAELAALLLEYGADADSKDYTGRPVLTIAVTGNKFPQAKLLLEHGADVQIPGNRSGGAHLLTTLIKQTNSEKEAQAAFLRLLLRHGSNPDLQPSTWDTSTSHTPVGHCIKDGKTELLRILLEHGADPHRSGQNGTKVLWDPMSKDTPFRYAVGMSKAESVRVLLAAGAITRLRGTQIDVDKVLLEAAATTKSAEILRMLLDEGFEDPARALVAAAGLNNEELVRGLEERVRTHGIEAGRTGRPGTEGWTRRSGGAPREAPPPYNGGFVTLGGDRKM